VARPLEPVDVAAILAKRRLGIFHMQVLAMCALALFAAGYDAQVIVAAAPAIAHALDLPASEILPSHSWSGAGSIVGLIAAGLGDRIGRRRVIILALVVLGIASLVAMMATAPRSFSILRFVAGLGLGALLPSALALTLEVMPARRRLVLTTLAGAGFPAGVAIAAPLVLFLLERWTWQAVFLIGGIGPIVLALVLWGLLPDSPLFLAGQGERGAQRLRATFLRISRRYSGFRTHTLFLSDAPDEPGSRALLLFRNGRAVATLALWFAFAAAGLAASVLAAGLAGVMTRAGIEPEDVPAYAGFAAASAILGGVVLAVFADRGRRFRVLVVALPLGAVALGASAVLGHPRPVVAAVLAASFLAAGGFNALGAFATASYPTPLRVTGAGWALASGRLGQAAATAVLGVPLSAASRMAVAALAALAAAAAAIVLARRPS
jgi:AAHS family 4-hydroxybenzoate transporter-like MFS transporter